MVSTSRQCNDHNIPEIVLVEDFQTMSISTSLQFHTLQYMAYTLTGTIQIALVLFSSPAVDHQMKQEEIMVCHLAHNLRTHQLYASNFPL